VKVCSKCGARQNDTIIFCNQCKEKLGKPISEEEKNLIDKQTGIKLEKLHKKSNSMLLKKILCILICILSPSVLTFLYFLTLRILPFIIIIGGIYYFITIAGIVLFFKFKPCNVWILPVGFILPTPIWYIYETLFYGGGFKYVLTYMVGCIYAVPFIIISIYFAREETN